MTQFGAIINLFLQHRLTPGYQDDTVDYLNLKRGRTEKGAVKRGEWFLRVKTDSKPSLRKKFSRSGRDG